jgi:transcriptional regulator with XRE-family HTH domain
MVRITELHKKWLKEPKYRKAYQALQEEFVLASALIDVRSRAALTQQEVARKIARLESGRSRPSMRTLERLAKATGSRLLISFAPRKAKRPAKRFAKLAKLTRRLLLHPGVLVLMCRKRLSPQLDPPRPWAMRAVDAKDRKAALHLIDAPLAGFVTRLTLATVRRRPLQVNVPATSRDLCSSADVGGSPR